MFLDGDVITFLTEEETVINVTPKRRMKI